MIEKEGRKEGRKEDITPLSRAVAAVPRKEGSRARREVKRAKEEEGKSLKASWKPGLYCWGGLKLLVSFSFFQYSSAGDPHSLKIL